MASLSISIVTTTTMTTTTHFLLVRTHLVPVRTHPHPFHLYWSKQRERWEREWRNRLREQLRKQKNLEVNISYEHISIQRSKTINTKCTRYDKRLLENNSVVGDFNLTFHENNHQHICASSVSIAYTEEFSPNCSCLCFGVSVYRPGRRLETAKWPVLDVVN